MDDVMEDIPVALCPLWVLKWNMFPWTVRRIWLSAEYRHEHEVPMRPAFLSARLFRFGDRGTDGFGSRWFDSSHCLRSIASGDLYKVDREWYKYLQVPMRPAKSSALQFCLTNRWTYRFGSPILRVSAIEPGLGDQYEQSTHFNRLNALVVYCFVLGWIKSYSDNKASALTKTQLPLLKRSQFWPYFLKTIAIYLQPCNLLFLSDPKS